MLSNLKRPITLKEGALSQLREAITLGHLAPGERLIERVLCEQLGVSRTVIRECIRHLESDNLVIASPNIGPTVATLESDEIIQIYEARALLEVPAVRSCALAANKEIITKLENHSKSIAKALNEGKIMEVLSEVCTFYKTIFEAGGKTVAWDLSKRLNARTGQLRAVTLGNQDRSNAGPEKILAIVNAIKSGDPDAAEEACLLHLETAKEVALKELSN